MRPLDPRLLEHGRAARGYVVMTAFIGLVTAVLVIVQAGLLAHIIASTFLGGASLDGDGGGPALRDELVVLALVLAARTALAWFQERAAYRTSASVKSALRRGVVRRALDLGPVWLSGQRTSELTTLATRGVDALDDYFAKYLPQLVLAVVVPVAILARIGSADLLATVTIIVTLPLIPFFMVLVGMATESMTRKRWRSLQRLGAHFLDVLAGLPTLKVFGRAQAQAQNIRRVTDSYRRESMKTLRVAFLSAFVLELLASISVALVAVGIGLRLVEGDMDLETGLLVLILAPEAYLPLRMVGVHYHAATEGLSAAEEVFDVLEAEPVGHAGGGPRRDDSSEGAGTLRRCGPVQRVRVEDLAVQYPGRDHPAMAPVSFCVAAGELVVLAGPSGSGKSSVVAVLMGFVRPAQGQVLVSMLPPDEDESERGPTGPGMAGRDASEVDLSELDLASWRGRVGWAPQHPTLFAGTVAENLRLSHPEASTELVSTALESAAADELLVGDGPEHLEVGERGVGLSAGQRRRVAVARALVRLDADLLVLDEPTADLDARSEARVLASLRERARAGAAVLVVGHRPAVLAAADRVVSVDPQPVDPQVAGLSGVAGAEGDDLGTAWKGQVR